VNNSTGSSCCGSRFAQPLSCKCLQAGR
jgi:hypothetical protein